MTEVPRSACPILILLAFWNCECLLSQPYIQYFGRLEASQNNIVHFDMKKSISVDGILVEYVGSSCSENVISIKMRVRLIHYSEM